MISSSSQKSCHLVTYFISAMNIFTIFLALLHIVVFIQCTPSCFNQTVASVIAKPTNVYVYQSSLEFNDTILLTYHGWNNPTIRLYTYDVHTHTATEQPINGRKMDFSVTPKNIEFSIAQDLCFIIKPLPFPLSSTYSHACKFTPFQVILPFLCNSLQKLHPHFPL